MDGLMFDTEKIYYETWFKFQDKYAFTFSEELRKKFTGKNEAGIRDELVNLLGSLDKVKSLRKDLEADRIESLKSYRGSIKKEGLDDLLEFLRAEKIKCALASSNDRKKIDLLLKKENIYDFFDFIISGEKVNLILKSLLRLKMPLNLVMKNALSLKTPTMAIKQPKSQLWTIL